MRDEGKRIPGGIPNILYVLIDMWVELEESI